MTIFPCESMIDHKDNNKCGNQNNFLKKIQSLIPLL